MSDRIQVRDRAGVPTGDLDLSLAEECEMRESLNGEHSLSMRTGQWLDEGMRLMHVDGTGKVREWVIDEPGETHGTDGMDYSYGATWSMQYDLSTMDGGERWASAEEGTHDPITAMAALSVVLAGQSMWEPGTVTLDATGGCSLYDGSRWDYLKKLIETFGGEMEPRIVVDGSGHVTHRYVDWLAHVGTERVTRRFDFGEDCTTITRTPPTGPRVTRVRPRGGQTKTDSDGVDYTERVGIENLTAQDMADAEGWEQESVGVYRNGDLRFVLGTDYIEDVPAAADYDWGHHPTRVVTYDVTQTKSGPDDMELFVKATADVLNHTRPKVTYDADVEQFSQAGWDVHGVALGDEVHVVDRKFKPVPLRIEARVIEVVTNLLDQTDVRLTIGNAHESLSTAFRDIQRNAVQRIDAITSQGTLVYVQQLLDQLNAELNAEQGYVYIVQGTDTGGDPVFGGLFTYDREVTDPLVGAEATKAIQINGGGMRFANTKTAQGAWNWTNVITADGYLGLAATIARITTGFIGDPNGNCYWDLDNGVLYVGGNGATTVTIDGSVLDASTRALIGRDAAYRGTSETTSSYITKAVACSGFTLEDGASILVTFEAMSTISAPSLNVNHTGAKAIYVNGADASSTNQILWAAGATILFRYDATLERWVVADAPGAWQATKCTVAASTSAKSASVGGVVLFAGTRVTVPMQYANESNNVTLNVSNTGSMAVVHGYDPTSSTRPTVDNGHSWLPNTDATFTFDGRYWRFGMGTYISGDSITTGTISTNRLDAGTIKSQIVQTTELNADKITSGTITGRTISGGTISGATIKSQGTGVYVEIKDGEIAFKAYPSDTYHGVITYGSAGEVVIRYVKNGVVGSAKVSVQSENVYVTNAKYYIDVEARDSNSRLNIGAVGIPYEDTTTRRMNDGGAISIENVSNSRCNVYIAYDSDYKNYLYINARTTYVENSGFGNAPTLRDVIDRLYSSS